MEHKTSSGTSLTTLLGSSLGLRHNARRFLEDKVCKTTRAVAAVLRTKGSCRHGGKRRRRKDVRQADGKRKCSQHSSRAPSTVKQRGIWFCRNSGRSRQPVALIRAKSLAAPKPTAEEKSSMCGRSKGKAMQAPAPPLAPCGVTRQTRSQQIQIRFCKPTMATAEVLRAKSGRELPEEGEHGLAHIRDEKTLGEATDQEGCNCSQHGGRASSKVKQRGIWFCRNSSGSR